MKLRLLLAHDTRGVYFELHEKRLAQRYRKEHPAYAGRHIREVIHRHEDPTTLKSGEEFEFWQ